MGGTVAVGADTYGAVMESMEQGLRRVSAIYRRHGLVPSWERVWSEGLDVTHRPPSTWGWPYSMYVSGGCGEEIQQQYLAWHAEALAERGGLA